MREPNYTFHDPKARVVEYVWDIGPVTSGPHTGKRDTIELHIGYLDYSKCFFATLLPAVRSGGNGSYGPLSAEMNRMIQLPNRKSVSRFSAKALNENARTMLDTIEKNIASLGRRCDEAERLLAKIRGEL